MAQKRPYPDGESGNHSPQMKTHVGEKEVNEGVNAEENMKKVHEKTLNMLMEGAKEQAKLEKEAEEKDEEMAEVEKESKEEEEQIIEPGQTYLNDEGKIVGVYVAVEKNDGDEGGGPEKIDDEKEAADEKGDAKEKIESTIEDKTEKEEEAEEGQPSLEQFGFKALDEAPCGHPSPHKIVKTSPAKSPAKSYELEKRPLDFDKIKKMEVGDEETNGKTCDSLTGDGDAVH